MIPVKIIRKSRDGSSGGGSSSSSGGSGSAAWSARADYASSAGVADYATNAGHALEANNATRATYANSAGDISSVERRIAHYATSTGEDAGQPTVSERTVDVGLLEGSCYRLTGMPEDSVLVLMRGTTEVERVRVAGDVDEELLLEPTNGDDGGSAWNVFYLQWTRYADGDDPEIVLSASLKDLFDVTTGEVPASGSGGGSVVVDEDQDADVVVATASDLTWGGGWQQGGTGELTRIELKKTGNVVSLSGTVVNATSAVSTTGIFTIPAAFRPVRTVSWVMIAQQWFDGTDGDGLSVKRAASYFCQLKSDGVFSIDKLNMGGEVCNYQAQKQMFVNGIWLTV